MCRDEFVYQKEVWVLQSERLRNTPWSLRNWFCAERVSSRDSHALDCQCSYNSSLPSSSALSSCYSRVYQSLANLIRWSDQVMLEGVNSEDKEMVTTVKGVIKAVLDGVKVWAQVPGRPRQGPRRPPCWVFTTYELVPKLGALERVCRPASPGLVCALSQDCFAPSGADSSHSHASLRRTRPDGRKGCQSSSLHRALE